LEELPRRCGDAARLYPGYFPETTSLLDPQTRYALVHIEVDLEKPSGPAWSTSTIRFLLVEL